MRDNDCSDLSFILRDAYIRNRFATVYYDPILEMADYGARQKIFNAHSKARAEALASGRPTVLYNNVSEIPIGQLQKDIGANFCEIMPPSIAVDITNNTDEPITIFDINYFGKSVYKGVIFERTACVARLKPGASKEFKLLLPWTPEEFEMFKHIRKFSDQQMMPGHLEYSRVLGKDRKTVTYAVPELFHTVRTMAGVEKHEYNAIYHLAVGEGIEPSVIQNSHGQPTSIVSVSESTLDEFKKYAEMYRQFMENKIDIKSDGKVSIELDVEPSNKPLPMASYDIVEEKSTGDDEEENNNDEEQPRLQSRTITHMAGDELGVITVVKSGLPSTPKNWKKMLEIPGLFKTLAAENADSKDFCAVLENGSRDQRLVEQFVHFFHNTLDYYAKKAIQANPNNKDKEHKNMDIPEDHLWKNLQSCENSNALCKIVNTVDTLLHTLAISVWQAKHPKNYECREKYADNDYEEQAIQALLKWNTLYDPGDPYNQAGDPLTYLQNKVSELDYHLEDLITLDENKLGFSRRIAKATKYLQKKGGGRLPSDYFPSSSAGGHLNKAMGDMTMNASDGGWE